MNAMTHTLDPQTHSLTLAQALEQYQAVFLASRKLAEPTRRAYVRDIQDLVRFLTEQGGISAPTDVNRTDLENYLAELDRRGLAGSTRQRRVFAIRSFFGYLADAQAVTVNPAAKLIPVLATLLVDGRRRAAARVERERLGADGPRSQHRA